MGEGSGEPLSWITNVALFMSVVLVLARATILETLRDPFQVDIGQESYPRGPGAGTGLILDLLACLPAMLVLLRAAIDRGFGLRRSWATALMLILGIWTILSPIWASDKFAAAVSAAHWFSGLVLLWSTSQLVRGWRQLRLVAAAAFALLLVLCAHGIIYRFVEVPELQRSVEENWQQILRERGWEPGSFIEQQFRRRVMGGEIIGFSASPNTFAAMVVMLGIVTAGLALQRRRDRDEIGWPTILALSLLPAGFVLWFTHSRTALATPALAAGILALSWNVRDWLARHRRGAFMISTILVLLVIAAIVAHGLWHGTLFHASLTFRWKYWVGAWSVFAQHPLIGVGFANFGLHYLGTRLPEAAEEINDPHNLFVRIFVELGIIGGSLLLAWLLRMWWELTRPVAPAPAHAEPREITTPGESLARLFLLALAAGLISIVASVDFSQQWQYGFIEVLKRLLYVLLMMIGLLIGTLRSTREQVMDDRPAPLLLHAMIVALAIFLVHNLIDFSLFESGPMYAFAMLAGAVLGIRASEQAWHIRFTRISLALAALLWMTAAIGIVVPVVAAEREAQRADDDMRAGRTASAARRFGHAFETLWIPNADYAFRAARAMILSGDPPDRVRATLGRAIETSPISVAYVRLRAEFEEKLPNPDAQRVIADYERVIELDPNDLSAHLDFARVLERFGQRDRAREQYEEVLRRNELMNPDEPERLPPARIDEIKSRIEKLK
jgi:O-antigen ligase